MPKPKATSKDVPGSGGAKKAAQAIESRKSRNASALAAASAALGRMRNAQSTDSNNR